MSGLLCGRLPASSRIFHKLWTRWKVNIKRRQTQDFYPQPSGCILKVIYGQRERVAEKPTILSIEEYEVAIKAGTLDSSDRVTVTMSAEEHRRRQAEGTLPDQVIMQVSDLRPMLENCRRAEAELRQKEWEESPCGRLSRFVRKGCRRIFS